jgi:hypothetical protein
MPPEHADAGGCRRTPQRRGAGKADGVATVRYHRWHLSPEQERLASAVRGVPASMTTGGQNITWHERILQPTAISRPGVAAMTAETSTQPST